NNKCLNTTTLKNACARPGLQFFLAPRHPVTPSPRLSFFPSPRLRVSSFSRRRPRQIKNESPDGERRDHHVEVRERALRKEDRVERRADDDGGGDARVRDALGEAEDSRECERRDEQHRRARSEERRVGKECRDRWGRERV